MTIASAARNGLLPSVPQRAGLRAAARPKTGELLVITSTYFNVALCFIKTNLWSGIANTEIICCDILILMIGIYAARERIGSRLYIFSALIVCYVLAGTLINPGQDVKIINDLAITCVFYQLGTMSSMEAGNRLLWTTMLVVLAVGFFELIYPETFSSILDIWSYYVDKGSIGPDAVNLSKLNLFLSSDRGDATRTFFPALLGSHRVSSVFLEPIALGNFAAITFLWCLSTSVGKAWNRAMLLFCALVCIVLTDSRFGGACCLIMLLARLAPFLRSRLAVFLTPVLILLALTVVGSLYEIPNMAPRIINDDFTGRLLFSARLLDNWNLGQWLGFAPSQIYTADTGYAYVINNLGLPLTLLVVGAFAACAARRREAATMKQMIAVYFATSLSISASVFSIKTAALLWFLFGTTNSSAYDGLNHGIARFLARRNARTLAVAQSRTEAPA